MDETLLGSSMDGENKEPEETNNSIMSIAMEEYGKLLDLIDDLRKYSAADIGDVIPTIIMVGAESSGKSTTMESQMGHRIRLPSGNGIVTRVPLIIRIRQAVTSERVIYSVSALDIHDERIEIKDISSKIEELTDQLEPSKEAVVNKPIEMTIYLHNVIPQTIIDLPGLVYVGNSEVDLSVKNMYKDYMRSQSTIILITVPANSEYANNETLKLAQEIDKSSARTLILITKCDLHNREGEGQSLPAKTVAAAKRLNVPVEKFFYLRGLKEEERKSGSTNSLEIEINFFSKHHDLSRIDKGRLGSIALGRACMKLQRFKIQARLSNILLEGKQALQIKRSRLQDIDKLFPKRVYSEVQELLCWSINTLKSLAEGTFKTSRIKDLFPRKYNEMLLCRRLGSAAKSMARRLDVTKPATTLLQQEGDWRSNVLQQLVDHQEGRGLPDYPCYRIDCDLVCELIDDLRKHVKEYLVEVAEIIKDTILTVFYRSKASLYPKFRRELQSIILNKFEEANEVAHNMLEDLLRAETNADPRTRDPEYKAIIEKINKIINNDTSNMDGGEFLSIINSYLPKGNGFDITFYDSPSIAIDYYKVMGEDISFLKGRAKKIGLEFKEDRIAMKIQIRVFAYYKIAKRRICGYAELIVRDIFVHKLMDEEHGVGPDLRIKAAVISQLMSDTHSMERLKELLSPGEDITLERDQLKRDSQHLWEILRELDLY